MRFEKGLVWGTCGTAMLLLGFCFTAAIFNAKEIDLLNASYVGTVAAGITSIVAIVLLYFTYQSQKRELKATQEALRQQKFDDAFFNMLNLLQEIIKSMSDRFSDSKTKDERFEGRSYLKKALQQLHDEYFERARINMRPNQETGKFNSFNPSIWYVTNKEEDQNTEIVNYADSVAYEELRREVAVSYENFYQEHQQNLGHYFRYLYNLIKYVLDPANNLDRSDAKRYLGILQSQLSNDEMGLIFYNVLSKHGRTSNGEHRFQALLDEYLLLENMDSQSLKEEWHHWFFPKTTFKFLDSQERQRKIWYQQNVRKFNIPNKIDNSDPTRRSNGPDVF